MTITAKAIGINNIFVDVSVTANFVYNCKCTADSKQLPKRLQKCCLRLLLWPFFFNIRPLSTSIFRCYAKKWDQNQGYGVRGKICGSNFDLSKISDSDSRLRNIKGMKFGC